MASLIQREKFRQVREFQHETRTFDHNNGDYGSRPAITDLGYASPVPPVSERGLVRIKRPEDDGRQTIVLSSDDDRDRDDLIVDLDRRFPPLTVASNQPLSLQFSNHLDKIDRNWRNDPFWRDLYPRWAEPIFKEGIDVKANIVNDRSRFAVDIDAYQFKPEELQVKTLDDTLLIEGRHEDVKDSDNFTKMYFIRKYQLPSDVNPQEIASSIDNSGRLTVEAPKRASAIEGRERMIPIEGTSRRNQSRSSSYSPRDRERHDSGRGSDGGFNSRQSNYSDRFNERPYTPKLTTNPITPADTTGYQRNDVNTRVQDRNGFRSESHREEYRSDSRSGFRSASVAPGAAGINGNNDTYSRVREAGIHERERELEREREQREREREQREREREREQREREREREQRERESRTGYRVETPASIGNTMNRREDTFGRDNRSESRSESVRSVRILRKTFE